MLKNIVILLAVSDFISGTPLKNVTMEGMVERGKPVDIKQFSYAVLLHFKESIPIMCGASLILVQIIITAATCTDEFYHKSGMTMAYLGSSIPKDAPVIRKVVNVRLHPNFKRKRLLSNLALGFLDSPVVFGPTVRKIVLPGRDNIADDGMIGFGIGWGKFEKGPHFRLLDRRAFGTQQIIISNEECDEMLGVNVIHVYGHASFCAVPSFGSFQKNEIGSALVFRTNSYMYLGGVLSYVHDNRIGVFTAIIDKKWIQVMSLELYKESCGIKRVLHTENSNLPGGNSTSTTVNTVAPHTVDVAMPGE